MGYRRTGRELALQVLYQRQVTGDDSAATLQTLIHHFTENEDVRAFALTLVQGVIEHTAAIDALITRTCEHWRFERLSKVDLNVLRIATYELMESADVPVSVVINEAIEIARRFGTEESAVFVNGVLDAIAQALGAKERDRAMDEDGRAVPTRSH